MKRGFEDVETEDATVACCGCGVLIAPNSVMKCAICIKSEVDIAEGVSRNIVLQHCRECNRYLSVQGRWIRCEAESRELLGICLKKVKGIGKDVKLVDASFIWTESHSKRVRVRISIQKEIASGAVLQQSMAIEFVVQNEQCADCKRAWTPHTWSALVQVRQRVAHRRTFFYLEQRILKNDEHAKVINIKQMREGLDFYFAHRSHAQRFSDFVQACVPSKQKQSKQLVSHDTKSNEYNYKYTIFMDLVQICADDLVFIPPATASQYGGLPPLMLCYKVTTTVHLVDPLTLRGYDIPAVEYWKRPLSSVCQRQHFTEFVVLNVEDVEMPEQGGTPEKHRIGGRHKMSLADVEIAKVADFGKNDERLIVRSHLGRVLHPGDHVHGYDIRSVNVSGDDTEAIEALQTDVILVRKVYKKKRHRAWALRRMQKDKEEEMEEDNHEADMEEFKRDLEEDPELRKGINLYVDPRLEEQTASTAARAAATDADEDDDEDDDDRPDVALAELLEGLTLDEVAE